jgi:site-specific DNA-adenine methylase
MLKKKVTYNNHFLFSYPGNKRKEYPEIVKVCSLDGVETIIEPFCGSCAFSFFLARDNPKKFKYILNDVDKNLIDLMEILKDTEKLKAFQDEMNEIAKDLDKEKYKALEGLTRFFIHNKIHQIRSGLFPVKYNYKPIDLEKCPVVQFVRNEDVTFSNIDAVQLIDEHKDSEKVFIFCDPPYLLSSNGFYDDDYGKTSVNIYEYIYKNDLRDFKSKILLTLEKNMFVNLLFDKYKKTEFDKKYTGTTKRKCKFLNIVNY